MRRGLTAWGTAVVLALIGTQVAHAVAYRVGTPDPGRREQLLSATGHGYLAQAPLALAIGFALLAVMLATEVRAAVGRNGTRPCAWVFLLVAPAVFTAQEHLERLAHDGQLPLGVVLDRTFQTGLALQLPFALAAYVAARLLLSAVRRLGRLLGAPPRRRPLAARLAIPRPDERSPRRLPALALGYGERGPPVFG
jgi:hypothetical protein